MTLAGSLPMPAAELTSVLDGELLLEVLTAFRKGDFTARMPVHWTGVAGKVADGLNEIVAANQALATELERVKKELVDQQKAITSIEDEARRAGVPSGWLRPGA